MMNSLQKLSFFTFLIFISSHVLSQKQVKGIITNQAKTPITAASILINSSGKETSTDIYGEFRIKAQLGDTIFIAAIGFEDTFYVVKDDYKCVVSLKVQNNEVNKQLDNSNNTKDNNLNQEFDPNKSRLVKDFFAFNAYSGGSSTGSYFGTSIPVFTHKDDTRGSRYLFDEWVKGEVVDAMGKNIPNKGYLFNYDKIREQLFVTQNKKVVIEIDKTNFSSFKLLGNEKQYELEKVPSINNNNLFQKIVVTKGKYCFYKHISTKLEKANYISTGLTESGHNYDEYIDDYTYYILYPDGKTFTTVDLKKKALKKLFADKQSIWDEYMHNHGNDLINEAFLGGFIGFLNDKLK